MSRYENDQEQIDVLKKWWKDNGTSLLSTVLVVVVGWSGWTYYQNNKTNQALQASSVFEVMQLKDQQGQFGDVAREGMKLLEEQPESPYAAGVALLLAKYHYQKGETDQATEQLNWVIANSADEALKLTAQLRLATIYLDMAKISDAKKVLEQVDQSKLSETEAANYQYHLAEVALADNRLSDAKVAFKSVIDNSDASLNLQNLARLQFEDLADK